MPRRVLTCVFGPPGVANKRDYAEGPVSDPRGVPEGIKACVPATEGGERREDSSPSAFNFAKWLLTTALPSHSHNKSSGQLGTHARLPTTATLTLTCR